MIQDGIDVALVGCDEGWVGEEVLGVRLLLPGQELTDAAHGAGSAIADEGDDEAHAVLLRATGSHNRMRGRRRG